MDIRKISIGPDYKNGAMHYIVGQTVLDGKWKIEAIKRDDSGSVKIYIKNENGETILWKEFTALVPISIEFNIDF